MRIVSISTFKEWKDLDYFIMTFHTYIGVANDKVHYTRGISNGKNNFKNEKKTYIITWILIHLSKLKMYIY